MKRFMLILLPALISFSSLPGQDFSPLSQRKSLPSGAKYADRSLSPAERAKDLIAHMTFQEKLEMTGGWKGMFIPGIQRLGLRPVRMSDASQGVHLKHGYSYMENKVSTSFPGMLALAATWNPELAMTFGKDIGEECRALGVDILLGPGINMYRTSEGGRNFEYMGEDPYLTSQMVAPYIRGLQSTQVIATAKHFICNDQEFCRHIASSDVDERALREIYLPPWKAAIQKGGIKAVMTGNNLVNGIPCSMNKPLMADILRKEYGFTGIAMTDWQNTCYHPGKQNLVLNSGESLLMSNNKTFVGYIENYIDKFPDRKKEIEHKLEKMIYPNLLTLFEMGTYDRPPADASYEHTFQKHKAFARQCAEEAICLLKNQDNILPVMKGKNILLMGEPEIYSGAGSGFVEGYDHVGFAEGLTRVYGKNFKCLPHPSDEDIKAADIVLYRLNKKAGEGHDVPFNEPTGAKEDILRCARLNPNIVVIISACNGLDMSWLPRVKGVLWCFFLGQERGIALADVISGKVSPSGHLPFTIEQRFEDSPDPDFNYLGGKPYWCGDNRCYKDYWLGTGTEKPEIARYIKPHEVVHIPYKEGVFIGYRWYEKYNKPVRFPFGFGLSYTTFNLSGLTLSSDVLTEKQPLKVQCKITNTGEKAGAEVIQLYTGEVKTPANRPVKELKRFKKVFLEPGETRIVTFFIRRNDLAYWDTIGNRWKIKSGKYHILIGSSSANIRLKKTFSLK